MCTAVRLVFICCVVVALGGEQIFIDLDGDAEVEEAPPPVGDSVLRLNSVIFNGNILQPNPHVKQWVVLYCLPWFQPCQDFQLAYNDIATSTQQVYNLDIHLVSVRFAQVDCSTDKVLCNDMGASFFPYVVIYEDGKASSSWMYSGRGSVEPKVNAWLTQQLSQSQAPRQVEAIREPNALEDALMQCGKMLQDALMQCAAMLQSSWLGQTWDTFDADLREALVLVAMSATLWALFRQVCCSGDSVLKKSNKADMTHMHHRYASAVESLTLPSDLRKRRHFDASINQHGKSILL